MKTSPDPAASARWWMRGAIAVVITVTLLAAAFGNAVWTIFTIAVLTACFTLALAWPAFTRRREPGDG